TAESVYVWPEQAKFMAYRFAGGRLDPTPSSQSAVTAPDGMPGGFLSNSAHGARAGTGILGASLPLLGNANLGAVPGTLRAFDAEDLGRELWNSEMSPERDSVGNFAKFNPPTVVNGKVYLGTFSGKLLVYGLLP